MAIYKSEEVAMNASAETVFSKLSNLDKFSQILKDMPADSMPDDKRQMLEQIEVTSDTISFPAGPAGMLTLKMVEKSDPTLIRMEGVNSPVPIALSFHIRSTGAETSEGRVEFDLKLPKMIEPMIGGTMKKMVGEFANMVRSIPF